MKRTAKGVRGNCRKIDGGCTYQHVFGSKDPFPEAWPEMGLKAVKPVAVEPQPKADPHPDPKPQLSSEPEPETSDNGRNEHPFWNL
ncbi:hypothetical protein [Pelagibius sp.]|uniref:hypothetical protein n=1 Tax=Pelagibius sp. TaxID=1931238 RepID=UPI00261B7C0C|nr:hypothetical protein [Pelagibius sp.]